MLKILVALALCGIGGGMVMDIGQRWLDGEHAKAAALATGKGLWVLPGGDLCIRQVDGRVVCSGGVEVK